MLSRPDVLGYEAQDLEAIATFKTKGECETALEAHCNPITGRFINVRQGHRGTVDPRSQMRE